MLPTRISVALSPTSVAPPLSTAPDCVAAAVPPPVAPAADPPVPPIAPPVAPASVVDVDADWSWAPETPLPDVRPPCVAATWLGETRAPHAAAHRTATTAIAATFGRILDPHFVYNSALGIRRRGGAVLPPQYRRTPCHDRSCSSSSSPSS